MTENQRPWMIYGANGYTGRLIAREAYRRGLRPILAGRNAEAIKPLTEAFALESKQFSLDQPGLKEQLRGVGLVLNCAGPFSRTAPLLMQACSDAGVHYLDITGEIAVIEQAARLGPRAAERGITLMPAVGFDVVPSDCLAKALAERLPGATHLSLAFTTTEGVSPGTAKTVLQGFPEGGLARIDGKIVSVPPLWKDREIPFRGQPRWAVTVPWGDVASAFYSTGIPNIETYMGMPRKQIDRLRRGRWLLPVISSPPIAWLLERVIGLTVRGPTDVAREQSRASLWGEVHDAAGRTVSGTLETPGGYQLTIFAALACIERTLAGEAPPGFATPAQAFGAGLILSIPGTDLQLAGP